MDCFASAGSPLRHTLPEDLHHTPGFAHIPTHLPAITQTAPPLLAVLPEFQETDADLSAFESLRDSGFVRVSH